MDDKCFENGTPHFFKVILHEDLHKTHSLKVPTKFVRKYGTNLSNLVHLKLPNGDAWAVELQRDDHGGLSLRKGWADFIEYCCICLGYFLVFRYEGDSCFHVVVFDATACEIEYPVRPGIHKGPCPADRGSVSSPGAEIACKEEDQTVESSDDEFLDALSHVEGFDDPPTSGGGEEPPLCCPQIPKTSNDDECHDATLNQGLHPYGNRGREKPLSCCPRLPKKLRTEGGSPKSPRAASDHFSPERGVSAEKSRDFQRATSFPVEGPCTKVVIRSLKRLSLSKSFMRTCFPGSVKYSDVRVCLGDGKTWTLQISKTGRPRFGLDWQKFVADNDLKVGDVCLFELMDSEQALFRATILEKKVVHTLI
ncbi:hypothetical protein MLD38_028629 [Melastoma candidum]|uniref:Uncharacterized protein n=1 Tax=Melastoma candidum TaxID=119954 RepID=A0ACB9N5X1_9MYRT|nr:hypothetical protein MLD38_028629 [Melastoma candidum]